MIFNGDFLLSLAGSSCLIISAIHIIILICGPNAYRFFGAGEDLARLAERKSPVAFGLTFLLALIICVFGFYAFSGATKIIKLPYLPQFLVLISAIFMVMGTISFYHFFVSSKIKNKFEIKDFIFSSIILATGLLFARGTFLNWHTLCQNLTF